MKRTIHVGLQDALRKGPPAEGELAISVFAHGTLRAELYAPEDEDKQEPHRRDEIYVVARGRGIFFDGEGREAVSPGSFIFVPAGKEHRFERFSNDFAVCVFFYGPDGGETP
jgi:mannose-6-phosphate isomerase-like protein (cupin superfamily)